MGDGLNKKGSSFNGRTNRLQRLDSGSIPDESIINREKRDWFEISGTKNLRDFFSRWVHSQITSYSLEIANLERTRLKNTRHMNFACKRCACGGSWEHKNQIQKTIGFLAIQNSDIKILDIYVQWNRRKIDLAFSIFSILIEDAETQFLHLTLYC